MEESGAEGYETSARVRGSKVVYGENKLRLVTKAWE
jgi:hypothetical protein